MITPIERNFIESIKKPEVSSDFVSLAYESAREVFGLKDVSQVKPSMAYNFVFNLYSKLVDRNLITISGKTPLLHVLNNIASFNLFKDNNRLMCFIIGEIRTCQLPEIKSIQVKEKQPKTKEMVFV